MSRSRAPSGVSSPLAMTTTRASSACSNLAGQSPDRCFRTRQAVVQVVVCGLRPSRLQPHTTQRRSAASGGGSGSGSPRAVVLRRLPDGRRSRGRARTAAGTGSADCNAQPAATSKSSQPPIAMLADRLRDEARRDRLDDLPQRLPLRGLVYRDALGESRPLELARPPAGVESSTDPRVLGLVDC